jgi:hypothetical protein
MSTWQPIETAPRDKRVLLFHRYLSIDHIGVGFWDGSAGCFNAYGFGYCRPTHWMPLPAPPNEVPRG